MLVLGEKQARQDHRWELRESERRQSQQLDDRDVVQMVCIDCGRGCLCL